MTRRSYACSVCGASDSEGSRMCPLFPEWGDSVRMGYLMSEGDDSSKSEFWTRAVRHCIESGGKLSVNFEEISQKLAYDGSRAPGVAFAFAAMIKSGELTKTGSSFEPPAGWFSGSWRVTSIITTPIKAAVKLLVGSNDDEDDVISEVAVPQVAGEYACSAVLQHMETRLSAYCQSLSEFERTVVVTAASASTVSTASDGLGAAGKKRRLAAFTDLQLEQEDINTTQNHNDSNSFSEDMSKGGEFQHSLTSGLTLRILCRNAAATGGSRQQNNTSSYTATAEGLLKCLSDTDAEILADYLVKAGSAVRDGAVIKLLHHAITASPGVRVEQQRVTAADKDALFVRATVHHLSSRVGDLQDTCSKEKSAALAAKKAGRLQEAVVRMRRYKHTSLLLDKAYGGLATLENVLHKLEGLSMDITILEAQEVSSTALKSFRTEHNLSVERIDEAVEQLEEELSAADDVSQAMNQMSNMSVSGEQIDEEQLEIELAQLEEEIATESSQAQSQRPLAVQPSQRENSEKVPHPRKDLLEKIPAVAAQEERTLSALGSL